MICRHKLNHFTVANLVLPRRASGAVKRVFATVKCYNLCLQIISNTNRVITIRIHSDTTLFQNVFVTLLRRVSKDVTSSLLSWHKRYDFKAAHFRRHSQWKCTLQTQWIRLLFQSTCLTSYLVCLFGSLPFLSNRIPAYRPIHFIHDPTPLTRSLWRDWSSTGLFLFYNLQKF